MFRNHVVVGIEGTNARRREWAVRKWAESHGCEDGHGIRDRAREGRGVRGESLCLQICLQVHAFSL